VLDIQNLCIAFHDRLSHDEVVHNFNLHMERGEIVGIVGESGSGKTQTALSIAGLLKRSKTTATGKILLNGTDLLTLDRESLRKIQGKQISMIFQEPMTSLNPTMRIGRQVEESHLKRGAV
jgi:ABC-type glutathione transport system ATPase component